MNDSELRDRYKRLFAIGSVTVGEPDEALEAVGSLADTAFDLKETEGIRHSLELADELQRCELFSRQRALLYYYKAVAWGHIRQLTRTEHADVWAWEQGELEHEIFNLRSALNEAGLGELPVEDQCGVRTNLGNALDTAGRPVEAIEYWDMALRVLPSFAMARGNRGIAIKMYAQAIHDSTQAALMAKIAYRDLEEALGLPLDAYARKSFVNHYSGIAARYPADFLMNDLPDMNSLSLGTSQEERSYRLWGLENRLFLNPLNDLGVNTLAAHDCLSQPRMVMSIRDGTNYSGFFNQLKQEFTSARFLLYEGTHSQRPHYADRNTRLINTLDYPSYSIYVEKTKAAYRLFYSIFDKIAFFLNDYLGLGVPKRNISFRSLWYRDQDRKKGLRPDFQSHDNWPLRGLFWLSKDLYDDRRGFRDSLEPEARQLAEIRNQMEHKFLKLHDDLWLGAQSQRMQSSSLYDQFAFSMYRSEFERIALKLARISRAAVIYLGLSVHREENKREEKRGRSISLPSLPVDLFDDDWKL